MTTQPRGGRQRRLGRPPKNTEKLRDRRVVVMVTRAEQAKLGRLAERDRLAPATLAYQMLSEALRRRR